MSLPLLLLAKDRFTRYELCRIQAYDRPTTEIVSCQSNFQLAYDCHVGPKSCRRPVVSCKSALRD